MIADINWFFEQRYPVFGHYFSVAGFIAFGCCFLAGLAVSRILQSDRVRRFLTRFGLEEHLAAFVTTILGFGVFLAFTMAGLNAAGLPIPWEAPIPGLSISFSHLLRLVVSIAVVFWVSSSGKKFFLDRFLVRSGMDKALQYTVGQVFGYVVLVAGILIALQNAGMDLSTLTVFAGAVGVGLGFGLQNIASNFISGLVILAERPIKIGDRVEVDTVAGIVRAIRIRSTTVMTNDNIAIIVPNSRFIEQKVVNWNHEDPRVRFRIPVGVAQTSDVEKVKEILLSIARNHPMALAEPAPTVFFASFGDFTFNFELVVWSLEMSTRPRVFTSDLNFAIQRAFREEGIELPFPQRDVHIRSGWGGDASPGAKPVLPKPDEPAASLGA